VNTGKVKKKAQSCKSLNFSEEQVEVEAELRAQEITKSFEANPAEPAQE